TLKVTAADEVTMAAEHLLAHQHLKIAKARLADTLRIQRGVDPSLRNYLLHNLVLHPFAVNTIPNGIAPKEHGGTVSNEAKKSEDKMVIIVRDDGLGNHRRSEFSGNESHGIGLANTEKRIKELYGEAARFDLNWPVAGGCQAILEIPYHQNELSALNDDDL